MKKNLLVLFFVSAISTMGILLLGRYYCWEWVGVANYETVTSGGVNSQKCQITKTFWDLVELLLVPMALSGGAWLLSENQKQIEAERGWEERYQKYYEDYLDKVGRILLKFDNSQPLKNHEDAKIILEALTITTLKNLDPVRKGNVIVFLYKTGLIVDGVNIISLDHADLSKIDLQNRFLAGINLSGSNLSDANLKNVFLGGRFKLPDLKGLSLSSWPDLPENLIQKEGKYMSSNLSKADLTNADLTGAKLDNTDFTDVTWKGATLRGARFKDAKLDVDKIKKDAKIDERTVFPNINT